MKYSVVAAVLLSTFVFAQASQILVENTDDFSKNVNSKNAFCGVVGPCDIFNDVYANSIQSRLSSIEKENTQLKADLETLSALQQAATQQERFSDYKAIADMKPAFWLSGTYFDGFKESANASLRTGVAPQTDVVGNAISKVGNIAVNGYRGQMAYIFDKSNSITSSVSFGNKFTFAVVYRFPAIPTGAEGRFFTSPTGNRLFAGWSGNSQEWYLEGWINENGYKTTDLVILIGTNDNGIKNLWTHNRQLTVNSNVGVNDWGQVVVGRPRTIDNEAAKVNVYEALAFNQVLNADQRYSLLSVLKKWYGAN